MGRKLEAYKGIMEIAAKMAPRERRNFYRSFGQPGKEGIYTSVIGKQGKKPGLYYDPNLPFIENYKYFRKPSATTQAIAKKKGHTLKDEYSEKRSRFIESKEEDPFVMAMYAEKVPRTKDTWVTKTKKVRKSEAFWHEGSRKWRLPISKESGRHPERKGRVQEIVDDIIADPSKYGLKSDPERVFKIPYKAYTNAVNRVMSKEGFGKIPHNTVKDAIVAREGTSLTQFSGTEAEKKMHKFLKTIDPDTKKPYFETMTSVELQKLPYLKGMDATSILTSRQRAGLNRTNIGKSAGDKTEPRLHEAERKLKQKIRKKYSYLSDDEVEALGEQGSIAFDAVEHGFRAGYKKRYPDKTIDAVFNFIEDTEILNRGKDPYYYSYIMERALNRLRTALSGQTHTMGHARKEAKDTWWFPGYESPMISPQRWDDNLRQHGVDVSFQSAIKRGDMDTALKEYKKMLKMGMRSSMVDEFGEQIFYGAPSIKGKMAQGGLVNGYSKGGKVMKLLDDAIGMMSRRKFMKGMGATAAATALPKSALKLAPAVIKKGALNFAPPWVNGMLSSLNMAKKIGPFSAKRSYYPFGNDASIINLGTKKIKVFKDQEAKITYFKVKTSDEKVADDIATSKGEGRRDSWDDVELREEPGETTITWKNKEYDGNDQHIVIDKANKETRFVDDNWHMEAGGGDIAKDDWIEWAITPNKNEIKVALKKPLDQIDDMTVDGYSVRDMENEYSGMFESYVDSFSPSGNVFGTVNRMVKQIKKKDQLRQQKKWNDEQVRNLEEKNMMDWEGQFRGGKGIHAYSHGGVANARDRVGEFFNPPNYRQLPAQANNWLAIQGNDKWEGLSKDQSRHEKTLSFDNPQSGIRAAIISLASRAARTNKSPNLSLNQIFFEDRPWAENQGAYRQYFKDLNLPTNTIYDMSNRESVSSLINTIATLEMGNEDYNSIDTGRRDHIINQGIDMAYQRLMDPDYGYYSIYENKFAGGGIARRPNAVPPTSGPDPYGTFINDSVSQIRSSPSEFMGSQFIQKFNKGGFVKRNAPKVLGQLTNYRPKLTMSDILKNVQKAKKKNTIGLTQTEKKAAILGDVKPEAPGAMFWGSREKIIGAPSEAMTGTQWLQYMKIGKHGILNPKGYPRIKDMELNDTSLAPWLSRQGNKTVSKPDLVRQFDEMAPTMDVVALGDTTGGHILSDVADKLKKIDTQAIRNPAIKGFYDYIKAVMPQLRSSTTSNESKAIIKYIDEMVYNNFGVKDALTEGVPQRFPFEIKEILQSLSTALGKRTAGFKSYKRRTEHEGTQMMEGGDNYREFLFRYTPGSLRQNEPGYKYAHSFNLSDADRAGGVVHTRTSDRGDEFGRRLLHIEEIQSDMHQKVNAAQRALKKKHAEWALKGKTPEGEYAKMSQQAKKDYKELVKEGKYAPRGDLKEEIGTANEQHLALIVSKVEDLLAQPQTKQILARLTKLKRERTKVRKMIKEEQEKMAAGDHSGIPQGPLSKTEDYNEFIMKYLLRVAREGGYDGLTINTAAIKNKGLNVTNKDYRGNLVAYGPMAKGAMEKAAKKSGAKFMKTYIKDGDNRVWEVPMILFKENKAAQALIDKGLPVYKKGGTVKK